MSPGTQKLHGVSEKGKTLQLPRLNNDCPFKVNREELC